MKDPLQMVVMLSLQLIKVDAKGTEQSRNPRPEEKKKKKIARARTAEVGEIARGRNDKSGLSQRSL